MNLPEWLTPTVLLLAVFAAGICGVLFILWFIQRLQEVDDVLEYRTCDLSTIESDVRTLQAKVPDAPRKQNIIWSSGIADPFQGRHKGRRFWIVGQPLQIGKTAAGVIAAAHNAAYRDNLNGTTTLNPEPKGSRFHVLWLTTYESERLTPEVAGTIRAQNEA
ncbi:hypothetical protein PMI15_00885 [Polaromonas sp. CF318]|uniref:hypothetical protein n=1 Tax=Polaromonas sp. CF318 TaxID=1144318 RepID=UPI0002711753|nr:hypothetical protein [Polaromonas sp. CF318]EJL87726.1 hypothetical protein PMI15_00885 [Polaromonas sp. CF318]